MRDTADLARERLVSVISTHLFEEQRFSDHQQQQLEEQRKQRIVVFQRISAAQQARMQARNTRMTSPSSTDCKISESALLVRVAVFEKLVSHMIYRILLTVSAVHHTSTLAHSGHHVLLSSQADSLDTG